MVTCQAGRPSSDAAQKLTTKQTAGPSSLATETMRRPGGVWAATGAPAATTTLTRITRKALRQGDLTACRYH